jgi:hypothetical protein
MKRSKLCEFCRETQLKYKKNRETQGNTEKHRETQEEANVG